MPDTAPADATQHADSHDWHPVTAPNGDRGFQCARCRLTAISLPVPKSCEACPHTAPDA